MSLENVRSQPPTSQRGPQDAPPDVGGEGDWLKRAQDAFRDSTQFVDNNYRKQWDDSIRAFHSQHPGDSKYNMPSYEKRSRIYRPKTRSIIRKNEAAAAAAFFSNNEVTDVQAQDPTNKISLASAEIMQQLLQYRLTKSIPWYHVLLGGLQDAQTVGVVCAHIYWEFSAEPPPPAPAPRTLGSAAMDDEYPEQGDLPEGTEVVSDQEARSTGGDPAEPPTISEGSDEETQFDEEAEVVPKVDRPVIDVFPVENLRIDPGANWMDPVNSSPYIIHLVPMYVMDVKEKMQAGEWRKMSDGMIRAAFSSQLDSTRAARAKDRDDPYSSDSKSLPDYEIVWVQRHIHRRHGIDWEFHTLSDLSLLTTPVPLKEVVFHGKRPYVLGCCVLETHRILPSGIPQLGKNLQDETNEIANQRIDNVKFVLNKKFFAKRGRDVDVAGLVRNVPGGVVMLEDPEKDVKALEWQDVTQSSYEEQSRIDQDMNDLLGNFSAAQIVADHGINGPAHNMALVSQSAGTLVEYLLRTFVETFVLPVLRQLILLEQKYETDKVILSLAAKKAELFQKFGLDEVTDELLEQELTLSVNVGMGATDPQMKLQKFLTAMSSYTQMIKQGVPGLNNGEVGKEIFGLLGYGDAARFFQNDNPDLAIMQQQIQQLNKVIDQLKGQVKEKMTGHQIKKEVAEIQSRTKLQETSMRQDGENQRAAVTHLRAIRESDQGHAREIAHKILDHKLAQESPQIPMGGVGSDAKAPAAQPKVGSAT